MATDPELKGIDGTEMLGIPDGVGLFSLTFLNRNRQAQPFLKDFEVRLPELRERSGQDIFQA